MGNMKGKEVQRDLDTDGRLLYKSIEYEGVAWIQVAQDRDQCCSVKTIMNLRVP
jgi:hypothetical protein